jgi:putative glycerol-1-phosphate prenyltransferase
LNAGDVRWIVRAHQQAIKKFGGWIPWENIAVERYIVLNPEAKVAKLTQSETDLSPEDVSAYAQLAEHMFHLPVVYIEYSGTYGDPAIVESAKKAVSRSILFYGGGIKSQKQAEEMARLADVVIVGNWLYEDLPSALRSPEWVKQCKQKEGMRERG